MVEVKLQDCEFPARSIQGALELLEKLKWFLSYREFEGGIVLFRGDRPIFSADSKDAIYAFVVGAALAYYSLPNSMFEEFKASMDVPHWQRHAFPGLTPLQD